MDRTTLHKARFEQLMKPHRAMYSGGAPAIEGFVKGSASYFLNLSDFTQQLMMELSTQSKRMDGFKKSNERLRTALTKSGKAQVYIDGFAAALETANSVCVLVDGVDHVSKADVIMRLEDALEKLKTLSFPLKGERAA